MPGDQKLSRRQFLRGSVTAAGTLLLGLNRLDAGPTSAAFAGGKLLGLEDFLDESTAPLDTLIATELDARLYSDLSKLSEHHPVTPTSEFYIRTAASSLLPNSAGWRIAVDGLVEKPSHAEIETLRSSAKPMGLHLMECSGNVRATRLGLISVADWAGVPISAFLEQYKPKFGGSHILVSGFDEYSQTPVTSVPGASWIFSMQELRDTHAFLATEMNGQPLTRDHGAPVRLVVPGWYGCSCIKWVNSIAFVDDTMETTSQMREFAARTLQDGIPGLVKDYQPPCIDQAAMPIRVEKWMVAGKLKYRVVGILWGGTQPVSKLQIRFNPDEGFVPVTGFRQTSNDPWTIWTYPWSPKAPGVYSIRLAIGDPSIQARKLNAGYYVRTVNIGEV